MNNYRVANKGPVPTLEDIKNKNTKPLVTKGALALKLRFIKEGKIEDEQKLKDNPKSIEKQKKIIKTKSSKTVKEIVKPKRKLSLRNKHCQIRLEEVSKELNIAVQTVREYLRTSSNRLKSLSKKDVQKYKDFLKGRERKSYRTKHNKEIIEKMSKILSIKSESVRHQVYRGRIKDYSIESALEYKSNRMRK